MCATVEKVTPNQLNIVNIFRIETLIQEQPESSN